MTDEFDAFFKRSISLATTWEECSARLEKAYGREMIPRLERRAREIKYLEWFAEADAKYVREEILSGRLKDWKRHFCEFLIFHVKQPDAVKNVLDGVGFENHRNPLGLPSPVLSFQKELSIELIPGRINALGQDPHRHFERGFSRWIRDILHVEEQDEPDVNCRATFVGSALKVKIWATVQLF